MALPTNPQNFLVTGFSQPPVTTYTPTSPTNPYDVLVFTYYNGTEPICCELWIEGLGCTQETFNAIDWALATTLGVGGPDTANIEILAKTHSAVNVDIKLTPYLYKADGTFAQSLTPRIQTFPDTYAEEWCSWYINTSTTIFYFTNINQNNLIGVFQRLVNTLNVKCNDFLSIAGIEYRKYNYGDPSHTIAYQYQQYEELYNGAPPEVYEEEYSYGETSGPGGGQGGSFDNSSDAVDFASLPTGGAAASGLITMFAPTTSQLGDFANFLWASLFDASFDSLLDSLKKWVNDPIESVVQLAAYPVTPPAGSAQVVKFCGIRSDLIGAGVSMNKCTSQFVDFDFGTLKTPAYWKQALDYSPYTTVSIYLPYVGICPLKADDVIDASLQLKYHIDLLTGGFSAELKCTKNINGTSLNSVLYNWSGNMATQIPITSGNFSQVFGALTTAIAAVGVGAITGGLGAAAGGAAAESATASAIAGGALSGAGHGLAANIGNVINAKPHVTQSGRLDGTVGALSQFTPYLIIERPVQSLSTKFQEEQGYPSNIVATLANLSGLTVCEAPIMNGFSGVNDDELAEIKSILTTGVIL